jgi:hypothetical protein
MKLLSRFVVTLTTLVLGTWAYVSWSLALGTAAGIALLLPFLCVWLVPIVYWVHERESHTRLDEAVHAVAYVAAGWLHFLILATLVRDLLRVATWVAARDGALYRLLTSAARSWRSRPRCSRSASGWLRHCAGRASAGCGSRSTDWIRRSTG